jgi:hypothetical protein
VVAGRLALAAQQQKAQTAVILSLAVSPQPVVVLAVLAMEALGRVVLETAPPAGRVAVQGAVAGQPEREQADKVTMAAEQMAIQPEGVVVAEPVLLAEPRLMQMVQTVAQGLHLQLPDRQ